MMEVKGHIIKYAFCFEIALKQFKTFMYKEKEKIAKADYACA